MPKESRHFGSSGERHPHFASRYRRHSSFRNSSGGRYRHVSNGWSRYQRRILSQDPPKFASLAAKNVKPAANDIKNTINNKSATEVMKEWDEVRCAVCMEHPHNAILLKCTSHEKGCRPFICDTSYRHSNCFDKFRKMFHNGLQQPSTLICPLCRGRVASWTVLQPARQYMNAKIRSCSREVCQFSGNYEDLRRHARREHPDVRPSEVDPERQRDWRRMEEQQNFGDLLSTIEGSGFGGEEIEVEVDATTLVADLAEGMSSLTTSIAHWWQPWQEYDGPWMNLPFDNYLSEGYIAEFVLDPDWSLQ